MMKYNTQEMVINSNSNVNLTDGDAFNVIRRDLISKKEDVQINALRYYKP